VGISTLLAKTADGPALIDRIQRDFSIVSIPRCAAEQYPRLVQGDADVCLFGRTLPWDHAAGFVFLSEAGGKATRFDGSPYRLDDRHGLIVAASENLWTTAMKSIGSVDS
jgi:fructose-1,6-bisphosphatase/inositol monophosphatase family enzyme